MSIVDEGLNRYNESMNNLRNKINEFLTNQDTISFQQNTYALKSLLPSNTPVVKKLDMSSSLFSESLNHAKSLVQPPGYIGALDDMTNPNFVNNMKVALDSANKLKSIQNTPKLSDLKPPYVGEVSLPKVPLDGSGIEGLNKSVDSINKHIDDIQNINDHLYSIKSSADKLPESLDSVEHFKDNLSDSDLQTSIDVYNHTASDDLSNTVMNKVDDKTRTHMIKVGNIFHGVDNAAEQLKKDVTKLDQKLDHINKIREYSAAGLQSKELMKRLTPETKSSLVAASAADALSLKSRALKVIDFHSKFKNDIKSVKAISSGAKLAQLKKIKPNITEAPNEIKSKLETSLNNVKKTKNNLKNSLKNLANHKHDVLKKVETDEKHKAILNTTKKFRDCFCQVYNKNVLNQQAAHFDATIERASDPELLDRIDRNYNYVYSIPEHANALERWATAADHIEKTDDGPSTFAAIGNFMSGVGKSVSTEAPSLFGSSAKCLAEASEDFLKQGLMKIPLSCLSDAYSNVYHLSGIESTINACSNIINIAKNAVTSPFDTASAVVSDFTSYLNGFYETVTRPYNDIKWLIGEFHKVSSETSVSDIADIIGAVGVVMASDLIPKHVKCAYDEVESKLHEINQKYFGMDVVDFLNSCSEGFSPELNAKLNNTNATPEEKRDIKDTIDSYAALKKMKKIQDETELKDDELHETLHSIRMNLEVVDNANKEAGKLLVSHSDEEFDEVYASFTNLGVDDDFKNKFKNVSDTIKQSNPEKFDNRKMIVSNVLSHAHKLDGCLYNINQAVSSSEINNSLMSSTNLEGYAQTNGEYFVPLTDNSKKLFNKIEPLHNHVKKTFAHAIKSMAEVLGPLNFTEFGKTVLETAEKFLNESQGLGNLTLGNYAVSQGMKFLLDKVSGYNSAIDFKKLAKSMIDKSIIDVTKIDPSKINTLGNFIKVAASGLKNLTKSEAGLFKIAKIANGNMWVKPITEKLEALKNFFPSIQDKLSLITQKAFHVKNMIEHLVAAKLGKVNAITAGLKHLIQQKPIKPLYDLISEKTYAIQGAISNVDKMIKAIPAFSVAMKSISALAAMNTMHGTIGTIIKMKPPLCGAMSSMSGFANMDDENSDDDQKGDKKKMIEMIGLALLGFPVDPSLIAKSNLADKIDTSSLDEAMNSFANSNDTNFFTPSF